MKFDDINLKVDAEDNEEILTVTCTLDGFEIGCDDLTDNPVVSFHRSFSGVGDAGPGSNP